MKYRITDQHGDPFGDEFDTLEAAEAELERCIEERAEFNFRENSMSPDDARPAAIESFDIVDADTGLPPDI
ncbi:MAG: hypothetical protein LC677_11360 [Halomonas sp.]|nr:hypothetical protein [Halomonas sp.]